MGQKSLFRRFILGMLKVNVKRRTPYKPTSIKMKGARQEKRRKNVVGT